MQNIEDIQNNILKVLKNNRPPTYILCNGMDMNIICNTTFFPEDHIFEWKDGIWKDLTFGIILDSSPSIDT